MSKIMRELVLPNRVTSHVELDSSLSNIDNIRLIFGNEAVQSAIKETARMAHPCAYERHGNDVVQREAAALVMDAFFEDGNIHEAENMAADWVDADEYYDYHFVDFFDASDEDSSWGQFRLSVMAAMTGLPGADLESAENFDAEFYDAATEALRGADKSVPLDQMKQALNVGVIYSPSFVDQSLTIEEVDHYFGVPRPDGGFKSFLQMVNLSASDYIEAVRKETDIDLRALKVSDNIEPGRARDLLDICASWRAFECPSDPSRPPLITAEQAIEIIENASYGGVPVTYGYLSPKALLDLPWGQEGAMVEISGDRGRLLVGIHNFSNGSGHFVTTGKPSRLPLDHKFWQCDDGKHSKYGIDAVYGLSLSAFYATPKLVQEPELVDQDAGSHPLEMTGPA
jgi:hypothetical protein